MKEIKNSSDSDLWLRRHRLLHDFEVGVLVYIFSTTAIKDDLTKVLLSVGGMVLFDLVISKPLIRYVNSVFDKTEKRNED